MKWIVKRQAGYYFEIASGRFSKYLGRELPEKKVLAKKVFEYLEEFSGLVVGMTDQKVKDYFKYTGIEEIEKQRFYFKALNHDLNRGELMHFHTAFKVLFSLNSSRAEGSRMKEVDLMKVKKPKTFEQKEAANAVKALEWAFSKEFTWSTASIRKIHYLLFHDIEPELAGKYKEHDNVAGDSLYGRVVSTTPHQKVKEAMMKLVEELKRGRAKVYPPILALESHLKFEIIHPFHDGNGRVGRILLNRILLEHSFMPVIFFEGNHEAYCNSIGLAREGRKDKYIKLFVKQMKNTRKKIEEARKVGGFYSERKNLMIQWNYSQKRVNLLFSNLKGKYKS